MIYIFASAEIWIELRRMEYDDSIVRQMVECIKVYPGGKLEIIFGGGYLVEESV